MTYGEEKEERSFRPWLGVQQIYLYNAGSSWNSQFLLVWQIVLEMGIISDRYVSKPTELVTLFFQK